jgi:NAD(P)H-hydrate epimerase
MLKKIITAKQIQKADGYTIEHLPIASIVLMEEASKAFTNAILQELNKDDQIAILCGCGNNGGDGFAVSRLLKNKGFKVTPYLVQFRESLSTDCQTNYDRLTNVEIIGPSSEFPDLSNTNVIIDAIFGSGLNGKVRGWTADFIGYINEYEKTVYAIDTPSGLDSEGIVKGRVIRATKTISFQRPKLAFFLPENAPYVGDWSTVNIGLIESYIQQLDSNRFLLDEDVRHLVKSRNRQSHKGTYGHALIVAGSYGKMGAAILATKAALRSGAGLVTALVPKCGYDIMQISVPEAMCLVDEHETMITTSVDLSSYSSIGIGPGLGTDKATKKVLKNILKSKKPVVIDADAINIISQDEKLKKLLHENCVLTPHIKEFDRLAGVSKTSLERFERQYELVKEPEAVVVLKDAHTSIVSPNGNHYFNSSGNPGMATGGSGDVLTGIITGLLAQGYSSIDAAIVGVYYHGVAGDSVAIKKGTYSLIASDLIDEFRLI